jgi:DNA-binding beta-propeller fold protein YncE
MLQNLINLGNGSFGGPMQITYRPPNQLAPNVYHDTITVTACLDTACVNPIAGSPIVIQSTYQVGNSVPGPNGYSVGTISLQANDLVWDNQHSIIYASVAATSASRPNTIVAIDPATGGVTNSVALGAEPGRLAISDDGTELYVSVASVGTVQRFSLPSLVSDLTISLGSNPTFGQLYAVDLAVAPGAAKSLAMTIADGTGIAIFDDASMRPNLAANVGNITWGSTAADIYGSGLNGCQAFSVSSVGLVAGRLLAAPCGGTMRFSGGLVYVSDGNVVDFTAGAIVATVGTGVGPRGIVPDGALSRIFVLSGSTGPQNYIYIYDLKSYALVKSFSILGPTLPQYSSPAFITWGTNGLAYTASSGQIVLVSGAYLQQ